MATDSNDRNNDNRPMVQEEEGLSLVDILENVVYFKWHFIVVASVVFALSVLYAIMATPVYTADVLIQIEEKKGSSLGALNAVAKALDVQQSPVMGEIEIIRSRNVIGRAVEAELAHTSVKVVNRLPLIGGWLARLSQRGSDGLANPLWEWGNIAWGGESLDIDEFAVPERYFGKPFALIAGAEGAWSLMDSEGVTVLQGKAGQSARSSDGQFKLWIAAMKARPANRFEITRYSVPSRINQMLGQMTATETKRQSSILKLTYEDTNPANAARMLNAIADAYLKQNLERRSEEADKSLKFLQEQLPELRKQLEVAEKAFNGFRNREKSIDISGEIKVLLDKAVGFEKLRMESELKRKELLQRYEPNHPTVRALVEQIASIKGESQNLAREISALPNTQQDYIRFARDVEVNNQLYVGLLNNAQQLQVARAGTTGNVAIIDRAVIPERPSRPNKPLTVAIGSLLGILLGFLASQLLAMMSGIVRDPKKLELRTGIQTFAILPLAHEQAEFDGVDDKPFLLAHEKPTAMVVEALRSLRTALLFALSETPRAKVVLVTSAAPGQGKSFISVNLAYLLAAAGKRVLLIDADVRRTSIKRYFALPEHPHGLSDVLKDNRPYAELVRHEVHAHLDLLPAGARVKNPGDLFSKQALADTISSAAEMYDFVVIDSPPVLPVNDAAALAKWADVTVFVARQDAVSQAEVAEALSLLTKAGKPVSGLVFNGYIPSTLRYGYGYGYGYGYRYRKYGGRYGKGYGKGYGYGYGYDDSESASQKAPK